MTTSTLMAANRMEPRKVIGTVSASEFLVAIGASVGFLLSLGSQIIAWDALAVLLLGGLIAAPVAAWLVRHLDHRLLGVVVSGNYAYVAAGSAGLQIVDVTNKSTPSVVASIDTRGNANDVVISGTLAFVADGTSGLQIIRVQNPLTPALAGLRHVAATLQARGVHATESVQESKRLTERNTGRRKNPPSEAASRRVGNNVSRHR